MLAGTTETPDPAEELIRTPLRATDIRIDSGILACTVITQTPYLRIHGDPYKRTAVAFGLSPTPITRLFAAHVWLTAIPESCSRNYILYQSYLAGVYVEYIYEFPDREVDELMLLNGIISLIPEVSSPDVKFEWTHDLTIWCTEIMTRSQVDRVECVMGRMLILAIALGKSKFVISYLKRMLQNIIQNIPADRRQRFAELFGK